MTRTDEGRIGTAKPLDHREWGLIGAYRNGADYVDNSERAVTARLRHWLELERRVDLATTEGHPDRLARGTLAALEKRVGGSADAAASGWTRGWSSDPDVIDVLPAEKGIHAWRVPHRFLKGLEVEFLARMRMRGAGYEHVLSPEFDYWDGWRLHLPRGVQWREATEAEKASMPAYERYGRVTPVGVEPEPCPFCGRVPTFRSRATGGGPGILVNGAPHEHDAWELSCCSWTRSPTNRDPRDLVAARAAALAAHRGSPKG